MRNATTMTTLRVATVDDVAAIERVMKASAAALCDGFYAPELVPSVVRFIATLDRQLVEDGTYFVAVDDDVERRGEIVGCGGWSYRDKLFTGTATSGTTRVISPDEPARVRAMFVHPRAARRGIGRAILARCEQEAAARGHRAVELMATLPGVPLYAACGYRVVEDDVVLALPDGVGVGAKRMQRAIDRDATRSPGS